LVPFALLRGQNDKIRSNENRNVFHTEPLGLPKNWCIVLFNATVFERVFFKTEDYNKYRDLTHKFIDLLDNEKRFRFLSKTSFA